MLITAESTRRPGLSDMASRLTAVQRGAPLIGLVLVVHSPDVARGLAAMIAQAAGSVPVAIAAGTDVGALGTSEPAVLHALRAVLVEPSAGAVVLLDLNSAVLALEMAIEELEPTERDRVRVSRGPLVEGALAASIAAAGGGALGDVLVASQAPGAKLPEDWPADGRAPALPDIALDPGPQ